MKRRAGAGGAWLILVSGVASAQVPGPAPTPSAGATSEPTPEAPPNALAPPAATPAPETAPEPELEPEPEPEKPRARVRWREPDAGSRSHDDLEREEGDLETDSEQTDAVARSAEGWSLQGPHFVLAVERLTSVLAWSSVGKASSSSSGAQSTEVEVSGTDVAFLGAGGAGRTVSGVPRLAFDAVLNVGFTIGGSLSYVASTDAKTSVAGVDSTSTSLPDQSVLLFAPRMGVLLRPSHNVGVWLRGGITRISTDETVVAVFPGGDVMRQQLSATLWHLSLDPQLVLIPAPRVAITIATIMDIGLPGTVEHRSGSGDAIFETEIQSSAYGVSAGLAAIF